MTFKKKPPSEADEEVRRMTEKIGAKDGVPPERSVFAGVLDVNADYLDDFDRAFFRYLGRWAEAASQGREAKDGAFVSSTQLLEQRSAFFAGISTLASKVVADGPEPVAKALLSVLTYNERSEKMMDQMAKEAAKKMTPEKGSKPQ